MKGALSMASIKLKDGQFLITPDQSIEYILGNYFNIQEANVRRRANLQTFRTRVRSLHYLYSEGSENLLRAHINEYDEITERDSPEVSTREKELVLTIDNGTYVLQLFDMKRCNTDGEYDKICEFGPFDYMLTLPVLEGVISARSIKYRNSTNYKSVKLLDEIVSISMPQGVAWEVVSIDVMSSAVNRVVIFTMKYKNRLIEEHHSTDDFIFERDYDH